MTITAALTFNNTQSLQIQKFKFKNPQIHDYNHSLYVILLFLDLLLLEVLLNMA